MGGQLFLMRQITPPCNNQKQGRVKYILYSKCIYDIFLYLQGPTLSVWARWADAGLTIMGVRR